jgi:hypothetical protein
MPSSLPLDRRRIGGTHADRVPIPEVTLGRRGRPATKPRSKERRRACREGFQCHDPSVQPISHRSPDTGSTLHISSQREAERRAAPCSRDPRAESGCVGVRCLLSVPADAFTVMRDPVTRAWLPRSASTRADGHARSSDSRTADQVLNRMWTRVNPSSNCLDRHEREGHGEHNRRHETEDLTDGKRDSVLAPQGYRAWGVEVPVLQRLAALSR